MWKDATILLALVSILFSCTKESVTANVPSAEYFPNKIGDRWVYDVYDSAQKKMQQVFVDVVGTTTLPKGEVAKIWVYKYPDKSDTTFVFQSGDTIKFIPASYLNPGDYFVSKKYIVPLLVGRSWANAFSNDSIRVIDKNSFTINNVKFDTTYFLKELGHSFNYFIHAEEYFAPGVGTLQLWRFEYNFSPAENRVWYLKQYYLK